MTKRIVRRPSFDNSVFVNCPFDEDYQSLLRPLLFTIVFLGYRPRLASERSDSGENRIDKICELVAKSRYSIHDLSRMRAHKKGELYRMNMPFELGLDRGCRAFGRSAARRKKCLILERERYDFQKALSDLSGVDIKAHGNEPVDVVRAVRNWFVETVGLRSVPSQTQIWYRFNDFFLDFTLERRKAGFTGKDLDMMPAPEFIDFIQLWVDTNRPRARP